MDEVFGEENCVAVISFKKTGSLTDKTLASVCDYLVWFAKDLSHCKFRPILSIRDGSDASGAFRYYWDQDGTVTTVGADRKLSHF